MISLVWVQICEQPLSSRHCRRAVVMTKIAGYSRESELEFEAYKRSVAARQVPVHCIVVISVGTTRPYSIGIGVLDAAVRTAGSGGCWRSWSERSPLEPSRTKMLSSKSSHIDSSGSSLGLRVLGPWMIPLPWCVMVTVACRKASVGCVKRKVSKAKKIKRKHVRI
jgi:hypothetical protein